MYASSTITIIGAGPAGLTAAFELLTRSKMHRVVVLEESQMFGGISRTVVHNGNRMDMGGHRFFTKVPEINVWWDNMLPRQGAPSFDDKNLHRPKTIALTLNPRFLRRNSPSPFSKHGAKPSHSAVAIGYPASICPKTANLLGFQHLSDHDSWRPSCCIFISIASEYALVLHMKA